MINSSTFPSNSAMKKEKFLEIPRENFLSNEEEEEKKRSKKGLKYIVHKMIEIYKEKNELPEPDNLLKEIFEDMNEKILTKNLKKHKSYQNLKRRIYDCRNVVISLVECYKEFSMNNQEEMREKQQK